MARHLAIGDIHGCYDALRTLCDFVGFQPNDVIITLGDYSSRGPNTNAVLDWLLHLQATRQLRPLRGNHDIMMVSARESDADYQRWIDSGGRATLLSYAPFEGAYGTLDDIPDAHWNFLTKDLLPYYESDTHFFVHANAYPEVQLHEQTEFMLYWESFNDPPRYQSGKIMVCRHTSQESGMPITNGHAICIDTRACGGGWLSCLCAETGMIWQANQRGQVRQFWLDEISADGCQ